MLKCLFAIGYQATLHSLCIILPLLLLMSTYATAQLRWTGDANDSLWATAANWEGGQLPLSTDNVLFDNSRNPANYTVYLPSGSSGITVKNMRISPSVGNSIRVVIPPGNTAVPALAATAPVYGIIIDSAGQLFNSSGATAGNTVVVTDSIRINNGGGYTQHSRSAHAALVTLLSRMPGTEKGVFTFDVPGGGYTFAATNRVYGSLVFKSDASGGIQSYAASAASPLVISGDLEIHPGVTINLSVSASTTIGGRLEQQGGVFNIASQSTSNLVSLHGDLCQDSGLITETAAGLPVLELNGTAPQQVSLHGSIANSVTLRVNNAAGIQLRSALRLPYKLILQQGVVSTGDSLLTLLPGCTLQADSASDNSFISGNLRKEGLMAPDHFLFPVGSGLTQRWLALQQATGNYTVSFRKLNPSALATATGAGIAHISSTEYWTIDGDDQPAPTASPELSFSNLSSGGVTDLGTLRVVQLQNGTWNDGGNTTTTGSAGANGSVTANSIHDFGVNRRYFTLASSAVAQNPLPLHLISFRGRVTRDKAELTWQPAPGNAGRWELEWSGDRQHYHALYTPDSLLLQPVLNYVDNRELFGRQSYRLKLTATAGAISYSPVVTLELPPAAGQEIQAWPVIAQQQTTIVINSRNAGTAQVQLFNVAGALLRQSAVQLQQGMNRIGVALAGLPIGWLTVMLTREGSCRAVRVFHQ